MNHSSLSTNIYQCFLPHWYILFKYGINYQKMDALYKHRVSFNRFNIPKNFPGYFPAHARGCRKFPAFSQYVHRGTIKVELTAVRVGLWTVSILKSARPRALVPRGGRGRLSDTVSTLESLTPFAPVNPSSTSLHAQAMAFPVLPLAFVNRSAEIRYLLMGDNATCRMFSGNHSPPSPS